MSRKITAAAVKLGKHITTGSYHGQAFERLRRKVPSARQSRTLWGYVTNDGIFLTREEAETFNVLDASDLQH